MPRILVVDDDPNIRRIVTFALTDESPYTVTPLSSAEAALLHIARHPVDLIFTDLLMPGMSGVDLVRRVRELELMVPVIVFTVSPEQLSAEEAAALKIDCLLEKPVSPERLRMAVDLLLDPEHLLPVKPKPAPASPAPLPDPPKLAVRLTPGAGFGGRSFSARQIEALHACMQRFSPEPDVYCALLADMSGILLTHWTRQRDLNLTNIAALATSSSIALTEIGRSLGKANPTPRVVIHEGEQQRILITQLDSLLLLLAIGKGASLGWARTMLLRTCDEIARIVTGPR
jgi:CheY-like chemotaxis protein